LPGWQLHSTNLLFFSPRSEQTDLLVSETSCFSPPRSRSGLQRRPPLHFTNACPPSLWHFTTSMEHTQQDAAYYRLNWFACVRPRTTGVPRLAASLQAYRVQDAADDMDYRTSLAPVYALHKRAPAGDIYRYRLFAYTAAGHCRARSGHLSPLPGPSICCRRGWTGIGMPGRFLPRYRVPAVLSISGNSPSTHRAQNNAYNG